MQLKNVPVSRRFPAGKPVVLRRVVGRRHRAWPFDCALIMTSMSTLHQAGGLALQQQRQCPLSGLRPGKRLAALRPSGQRALVQIKAVAAPEKTTTTPEAFRAWDSPSVKQVAKRTDLKK
jgi:hypothetical protein